MVRQYNKRCLATSMLLQSVLLFSCISTKARPLPAWMQPGVRVNSARLEKKPLLTFDDMGLVTDIQRGELRSPGNIELGIAGNYGAKFFDEHGKFDAVAKFAVAEPETFRVSAKILGQTPTHPLLFFRQAGTAATYDSLCDFNGKELWRTPYHSPASAIADFSDHGGPEFVFARSPGLIEATDSSGNVTWQTSIGFYVFSIASLRGTLGMQSEIVADSSGTLIGLGPRGELLFQRKPASPGFGLYPITWPGICDSECLPTSANDGFLLLKTDGQSPIRDLPGKYVFQVQGEAVRLSKEQPPFLAVVGLLFLKGKKRVGLEAVHSYLYIYDSNSRLVYDEVLAEHAESLGGMPRPDGKGEDLLVGGDNRVWAYSMAQTK
jgi:hypothetical protein